MKREKPKEKSRNALIVEGLIEPEENERYLLNLRKRKPFNEWDKDKLHEVAVMGGKAVQELHGERRTAREALGSVLTLKVTDDILAQADIDEAIAQRLKRDNPNATIYDLIQAVAVGKALEGSARHIEYIRDTNGDKPIDKVEVTDNITTDADRALMSEIADRLRQAESVQIVSDITGDDVKTENH